MVKRAFPTYGNFVKNTIIGEFAKKCESSKNNRIVYKGHDIVQFESNICGKPVSLFRVEKQGVIMYKTALPEYAFCYVDGTRRAI